MNRVAWVAVLVALVGCGTPPAPRPAPPTALGADGFPVAVTDSLGRTVTIPRKPERIVSLTPATTETLFAIGAGPRVVAVTEADTFPPEATKLPKFNPIAVNTEALLARRPDLVFTIGPFHRPLVETLEKFGVTAVALEPPTTDEVADTIELIGRAVGCEPAAKGVAADFRRRLVAVRARTKLIPEADRPKVLYVLWDEPLQAAGPGTFIGRMIADAGGTNVIADVIQQYPRVNDEAVLRRDPDLVIAPDGSAAGLPDRLRGRPVWANLSAVRRGRVVTVPEDLVNRPGPRLVDGLEAVERLIREDRPGAGVGVVPPGPPGVK